MDQYIGKFLDNRYELLEVIGTGGMAVVYKARCHRLNRLVAVKVLKADLAQDAEFRRRFHDESQAVAMLSHPNIVAVYDVSHSDDLDYIVMELIDGITLKQYMQKKGPSLNWREALHFITQIMRALSHAHSRGIIHRDIKPHNIMVLRDGSVKVSDFGIARITSAHQSTLTQEALGSVHYISPEQARGSHIDARSDIYSAGVVLYEMITGRLPFEGETPVAVAIQHINSIPLSPRELDPELPEALEAITMKAMAPDADQRYLDADEMLADLEEFRKNPNINFDYSIDDLKPCDEPTRPVPVGQAAGEEPPARTRQNRNEVEEIDDYDDRKGPIWPILLAVGAILVFLIGIVWFLFSFKDMFFPNNAAPQDEIVAVTDEPVESDLPGDDELVIPDVGNKRALEARTMLERLGLEVTVEEDYARDEYSGVTQGFAMRTVPAKGQPFQPGDKVTLVISKGPNPVNVPPLTSMSLASAKRMLEADGDLDLGDVVEVPLDRIPEEDLPLTSGSGERIKPRVGEVYKQSPAPGEEVLPRTVVKLWVCAEALAPEETAPSQAPGGQPTGIPMDPVPSTQPPADAPSTPAPPAQPPKSSRAIFVHLPSGMEGKSSVQVRIEVDGQTAYNQNVEVALFPISPLVSGRGTQQVSVYVDGVLEEQYNETFSR